MKEYLRVIVTVLFDPNSVEDLLRVQKLRDSLKEHGEVTTERARPKKAKKEG